MNYKSTAILAITACLVVAAYADQSLLDCRKLVYSRNCRGVANKRGDTENGETQSGNLRNGLSLKRLIYNLGPSTAFSLAADTPSLRRDEAKAENELQQDKLLLDHLLYQLFSGNNRRNNDNDYSPLYEY